MRGYHEHAGGGNSGYPSIADGYSYFDFMRGFSENSTVYYGRKSNETRSINATFKIWKRIN